MKALITSIILAAALPAVAEFKITPENLREGKLVKGSESSQGVGLYSINRGVTTSTIMVLMDKSLSRILAEIPIRSAYGTPQPVEEWLDVAWNAEGTAVAIHDGLDRDSKVRIFHADEGGGFAQVDLPDLRLRNANRIGVDVGFIKSSGQKPIRWINERLVKVEFRYSTSDGKRYRRVYPVAVDEKWRYMSQ